MKPAARSKASRAAASHRRPVTAALRRWLLRGGSLSAHVHALGTHFEVQRLSQRVDSLLPSEAASLGVAPDTRCVVREVVLRVDGRPLIFARSVTPARALHGPWRSLGALGTRPLAQLLFDSYEVTRGPLRVQALPPVSAWRREVERGWKKATGEPWGEAGAWARYSIFWKAGVPLRVTEVFTPAMRRAPCPSPLQDRQAMRTLKRGKPSTSASSMSPRTTAATPSGVPV